MEGPQATPQEVELLAQPAEGEAVKRAVGEAGDPDIRPASNRSSPVVTLQATATQDNWLKDADLEGQKSNALARKFSWTGTLALAYSSVGVIYGDIGTSPLYVYSSTFTSGAPEPEDVLGAASVIFWTLTLMVVVKYCLITLLADDNGEGGTFAAYALLCRHAGTTAANHGPPDTSDVALSRYSSFRTRLDGGALARTSIRGGTVSRRISAGLRRLFATSAAARGLLLTLVLLMTSMLMGDAILTPAQSVLGAIYGVQVKIPETSQGVIVGISVAILIAIFAAQRYGTPRIGAAFAPIVLLWFLFNVIVACYNIHNFNRGIFKALSPHYVYRFFQRNRHEGWRACAGLFLAITGGEALYADLGHFSRPAIRLSFMAVAYPCLVITYLGQAAWLTNPANAQNVASTFYASIPFGDGFYWVFFLIATAASCVASQAMISAAFSVVKQSMALGCFPRLTVTYLRSQATGSVYLPEVNWVLMVACVAVTAAFKTTTKLGAAYGVTVSGMMFGTTLLITLIMLMVWEVNVFLALAFLLVFGFIDNVYFTANLTKIPDGGWFAVAVAGTVFAVSLVWWYGTRTRRAALANTQKRLQNVMHVAHRRSAADVATPEGAPVMREMQGEQEEEALVEAKTGEPLLRPPTVALLYSETLFGAPPLLDALVSRWRTLHRTLILVTVRQVEVPTVGEDERVLFQALPYPGVFRCVVRYGYLDRVEHGSNFVASLLAKVAAVDPVRKAIVAATPADTVTHIVSHSSLAVPLTPAGAPLPAAARAALRRFVLEGMYGGVLARFARRSWEDWGIPQPQLFVVGMVMEV